MICSRKGRRAAALLPLLVTALWLMGKGTAQEAAKPEAAEPAETSYQPATYVGSAVCQACHEDIFNGFQKSPHFVVEGEKKRG
jgi:hypothetical protein